MPVVTYSLLRLGVFVLALLGLWLAGMGSWLLVIVATIVAAALSYVLFGKQRVAAARWLADRRAERSGPRFSRAVEDDAAAEDAIADRLHGGGGHHDAEGRRGDPPDGQIASPSPSSTP